MKKILLIIGGVILTLCVILFGVVLWVFTGGSEATMRSDQPLSREAAKLSQSDLAVLPESAKNFYYLFHAEGMQGLEEYLRFDVAPHEREATVEAIIQANNAGMKRQLRYDPVDIHSAPHIVPSKRFLPMPWWNTDAIKKGYYRGEDTLWPLNVWVDTENSIVYVFRGD